MIVNNATRLAELAREYRGLKPLFQLSRMVIVPAGDIVACVQESLPNFSLELLDSNYGLGTIEDYRKIVRWDISNTFPYIPERRDCDNYGFYMASYVSMYWCLNGCLALWDYQGGHFYNLLITDTKELYVFEPQTDMIVKLSEFKRDGIHPLQSGKLYGF